MEKKEEKGLEKGPGSPNPPPLAALVEDGFGSLLKSCFLALRGESIPYMSYKRGNMIPLGHLAPTLSDPSPFIQSSSLDFETHFGIISIFLL